MGYSPFTNHYLTIPKLIQVTELKNKESVYGVPHDRGAQAILRKNKINIPIGFLKLIWCIHQIYVLHQIKS